VSPNVYGADQGTRELTALEMALNLVAGVQRAAAYIDRDELGARVHHAGEHGFANAQLAANLAVVSIAQDLHKLVSPWDRAAAAEEEDGAVADARRTREHMRGWAAGEQTHRGETL
jgi:hypothetical protein